MACWSVEVVTLLDIKDLSSSAVRGFGCTDATEGEAQRETDVIVFKGLF